MSESTFKVTVFGRNNSKNIFYLKHFVDMIYPSYRAFNEKLLTRLEQDVSSKKLKLFWIDEDGDEINLASDEDLRIFVENPINDTGKPLKVFVRLNDSDTAEPVIKEAASSTSTQRPTSAANVASAADQPLHINIVCDGCEGAVAGYRYKCLQCPDYDLCITCESGLKHSDHLMVRIPAAPKELLPQKLDRVLNLGNIMSTAEEQIRKCSREADKWKRVQEKYEEKCKRREDKHREKSERREEKRERAEEKCSRRHSRRAQAQASATTSGAGAGAGACPQQNSFFYQAMDFLNYMMNPDNIMEHMPRDPTEAEEAGPTPAEPTAAKTATAATPAPTASPVAKPEKAKEAKEVAEKPNNKPDKAQEAKEKSNEEAEQATIGLENLAKPSISNAVPLGVDANGIVSAPIKEVTITAAPVEQKQVAEKSIEEQLAEKLEQMERKLEAEKKSRSNSPTISYASSEESLDTKDNEKEWTVLDKEGEEEQGATALNTGAIPKEPKQDKATSTDQSETSSTTGSYKSTDKTDKDKGDKAQKKSPQFPFENMTFEKLGRDLRAHIQQAASQAQNIPQVFLPPGQYPHPVPPAPQPVTPQIHHPKPHINHAVETMIGMGFSNEGGWLTSLLESVDGQIPRALDLLQPHK